jgi:glycosidase
MLWGDGYTTTYTTDVDPSLPANVGTVVTQQADTTSILRVYRKFTRARNTYPALAYGTMTKHSVYNQTSSDTYPSLAAWYRTYGSEKLLVLHNLGNSSLTFPVTDQIKNAVVCHGNVYVKTESAQCTVKMDAYSSVVFEIQ